MTILRSLKKNKIFVFFLSALLLIGTITISPTAATSSVLDAQGMIDLGIIDRVAMPSELGLDHLELVPAPLIADSSLIASIREAESQVSILPEDLPLRFDLGTNSPISYGQLPGDTTTPFSEEPDIEAVGYIDAGGNPRGFSPSSIAEMFDMEADNGGSLNAMAIKSERVMLRDGYMYAQRFERSFDLIVQNKRTGETLGIGTPRSVPIKAEAVCRDALNAVFNNRLTAW